MSPPRESFLKAWLIGLSASLLTAAGVSATQNVPSSPPGDKASFSVRQFGAACDGVKDDSVALSNAADALANSGAVLDVPGDCRIRLAGAAQVWLRGIHLRGPAVHELGRQGYTYGQQGGTILLADAGKSPFLVSSDWTMEGLTFIWPAQTEYTIAANKGVPVFYPPLIVPHFTNNKGDIVYSWSFIKNQVENAYDIADLRAAEDVGHWHWDDNQEFAIRYHIRLHRSGGESWVTNNQFSLIAQFYGIAGTNKAGIGGTQSFYMRDYAIAHAELLRIEGNGTPARYETSSVDGLSMKGNDALAMRFGIHVVGGTLNIGSLIGNSFDQVPTVLQADSGGAFLAVHVVGGEWLCQPLGGGSVAPAVSIDGASGNTLSIENVQIPVVLGPAIVFNDNGAGQTAPSLSIIGGSLLNVGNIDKGNPYSAINFNAPNGTLTVAGMPITTTAFPQNNAKAIVVTAARAATFFGITFGGWSAPLVVNATTGFYSMTGSTSYGTTAPIGTPAVLGPGAALVAQGGNKWDASPASNVLPAISLTGPSDSETELSVGMSRGGVPQVTRQKTDSTGRYHVTAQGADVSIGSNGVTSPGFVPSTSPTTSWSVDNSANNRRLAAGATFSLPVGSGMVLLREGDTGNQCLFLVGIGKVSLVSQLQSNCSSVVARGKVSLSYSDGIYTISNGLPISDTINITDFRNSTSD